MGKKRLAQLSPKENLPQESETKPEATVEEEATVNKKATREEKVDRLPQRPTTTSRRRSHNYLTKKELLEPGKAYTVDEGLDLIKKMAAANFDETVEVHLNLKENPKTKKQMVKTTAKLPHQREPLEIKSEPKAPIIHTVVGKTSSKKQELRENLQAVISTLKKFPIANAYLKSTMGPSVRLRLEEAVPEKTNSKG